MAFKTDLEAKSIKKLKVLRLPFAGFVVGLKENNTKSSNSHSKSTK